MKLCSWLVVKMVLLSLAAGCTASAPMTPQQALTRIDAQATKKKEINEQIFSLGARSAVKGSQDYQVGAEDLIEISVYGEEDLRRTVRVNGQGVKIPANLSRLVKNQEPDIILKEHDVMFVPESAVRKFLMDVRTFIGGGMSIGYAVAP